MNLNGKIMVITGASSGIGAATARAAAQEGASVVLLARSQSKLETVAEDIRRSGKIAHVYAVDLTIADAVGEVARRIASEVGTPDIIFNNAGAGKWLSVEETEPDEAMKMMAVSVLRCLLCHQSLPARDAETEQRLHRQHDFGGFSNGVARSNGVHRRSMGDAWLHRRSTGRSHRNRPTHDARDVCQGGEFLLGEQSWQRGAIAEGPVDGACPDSRGSGPGNHQRNQAGQAGGCRSFQFAMRVRTQLSIPKHDSTNDVCWRQSEEDCV